VESSGRVGGPRHIALPPYRGRFRPRQPRNSKGGRGTGQIGHRGQTTCSSQLDLRPRVLVCEWPREIRYLRVSLLPLSALQKSEERNRVLVLDTIPGAHTVIELPRRSALLPRRAGLRIRRCHHPPLGQLTATGDRWLARIVDAVYADGGKVAYLQCTGDCDDPDLQGQGSIWVMNVNGSGKAAGLLRRERGAPANRLSWAVARPSAGADMSAGSRPCACAAGGRRP
jgi:hypothetical protein